MPSIALVDDDRNILTSVSMVLEAEGYDVDTYTDGVAPSERFSGELCGGRVANLLPGVWSTRTWLKLRNRSCERWLEVTKMAPPKAPEKLAITGQVCTDKAYSVMLGWVDVADNEEGYRVYRDGALIATLGANASGYTDQPAYGGPYTYGVEAYNSTGASARPTVQEPGCIY